MDSFEDSPDANRHGGYSIRDSWWQRNGEVVYCTRELASSFASCAIRTSSNRRHSAWEVGIKLQTKNIADSGTSFWRLNIRQIRERLRQIS
jgi:hypothetical protein